ncbi:MAG: hypothetical protein AAGA90_21790 [Actinomycetota bacterium]
METPLADPPHFRAEPVRHGSHARGSRLYLVLRGLVATLVGLNLLLLAMLIAVTLISGGDDGSDVATETPDPVTEPYPADPAAPVTDESADGGSDVAADPATPSDDPVEGSSAEPAEPAETPVVSTDPPPYPDPFEPTINEVQPAAKRMGGLIAYLITNYESDTSLADVVATLPPGASQIDGLVAEVDIVHHPNMWSRGTVEYVQLGGHLNGRISNIVVIRQELGVDGSSAPLRTETRVMEVRLARDEAGEWVLETIASSGGEPAVRPADLSDTAAAVVDHDRIDLPDTAAWDIYNGLIDRNVLEVMLDIAERTPYSVVVLQTGHSYNVFGTDRVSNHSVGRAVDIYKLEDELVVDSHATFSAFYDLSEWIVSRYDIREFGSPWRFPDAVAHTFTNEVHHDHLHIGLYPWPTSPNPPAE